MWSNRIVGYSIDSQMTSALAVTALNNAVLRRGNVRGCVLHTDRGSQFRSRKLQRALTGHGVAGSMGRVGAAGDNAAMESFFSLLQKNVLNRRSWATRDELRIAIRNLDRADVPPTAQASSAGAFDSGRVRSHHERTGRTRCLTQLSPTRAAGRCKETGNRLHLCADECPGSVGRS